MSSKNQKKKQENKGIDYREEENNIFNSEESKSTRRKVIIKKINKNIKELVENNEQKDNENFNNSQQSDNDENIDEVDINKIKSKSKNKSKNNINKKKRKINFVKYLAQIEQLKNEIVLEKKLNESLNCFPDCSEEINKIQIELEEKTTQLNQLKLANKKQEEALSQCSKALEKNIKKLNENKTISQQRFKSAIKTKTSGKTSKLEALNIIIKIKDKEINQATKKLNILKKENESLKNELYKNNDYTNKLELRDCFKENEGKIKSLIDEIKIVESQLEVHKKCINEQNKLNNEFEELKNQLKEIKNDIIKNKKNIQDIRTENSYDNKDNKSLVNRNDYHKINSLNINTTKSSNVTGLYKLIKSNRDEDIILPSIKRAKSKMNHLQDKNTILTDDFISKIKKYFEGDEYELGTLINKISKIEKSRNFVQNKHRNEIKVFNSQIANLDGQYQILNTESKGTDSNIRVLKYKLNSNKNEVKHCNKLFSTLKNKYENIFNLVNQKDYEITLLLGQIKALKNIAKCKMDVPEDEVSKYVEKLKKGNEFNSQKKNDSRNLEVLSCTTGKKTRKIFLDSNKRGGALKNLNSIDKKDQKNNSEITNIDIKSIYSTKGNKNSQGNKYIKINAIYSPKKK